MVLTLTEPPRRKGSLLKDLPEEDNDTSKKKKRTRTPTGLPKRKMESDTTRRGKGSRLVQELLDE